MHALRFAAAVLACTVLSTAARPQDGTPDRPAPAAQANGDGETATRDKKAAGRVIYEAVPGEHALLPILRLTREAIDRLEKVKDYSCTLVRRERIDGELKEHHYQYLKIRHKPFSVYTYYQAPKRGSEVIYVAGQNNGQLWAHEVGAAARAIGTLSFDPQGPRARKESRYPITQAGLINMARRVSGMVERDSQFGECEVKTFPEAKINGRPCLCIQVTHPTPRREFKFHVGRVFFDHEWAIPVRFEGFTWPKTPGGDPELYEEYSYLDLKFDNGFTDKDFDIRNPDYNFPLTR
jgi:hypothetical protein